MLLKALTVLGLCSLGVNGQWNPNYEVGRDTMVHLFEWRWNDIAAECERFLGPYGYGGVQISPPNENAVITNPFRPWWERYQPVSYKLETRSGNEVEFKDMVQRCNKAGVRIFVDAVINHMTGNANAGQGTGGSSYSGPKREYPEVPYGPSDFNNYPSECPNPSGSIGDYSNPLEVRNCELSGLRDLKLSSENVQSKIVEYMNKLISYGVAGFRIDASKHMWPDDIHAIVGQLSNLSTTYGFKKGSRPFIYQEVIDLGNEPIQGSDYFKNGVVTEFKYGKYLGEALRGNNQLRWLVNWGEGWSMYPSNSSLAFIDNHDNQRGHGAGGANILTFRDARWYKMANAILLGHPYGHPQLMSSYYWAQNLISGSDKNDWIGPPNTNGSTNGVIINPDLTCGGGWICEHRWRQIYNMVRFRNVVAGAPIKNWWDNGNNAIAFSRGDKGFIAISNEKFWPLAAEIQTGLPAGLYCDVISGNLEGGSCTGKTIRVDTNGKVKLFISPMEQDPMIAIHEQSKLTTSV